jgi:predicted MFS family arabinose efflux permease
MADFGNDPGLWAAKGIGAAAGAAVSLIYMLPKGKREAASRFFTGLSCGLIFGGPAGLWIVTKLDIAGSL